MQDTSVASSFHVNSAVVQKTWRRLCQIQRCSSSSRRSRPVPSRHPAAR
jgi:hypothetical protein